jgi:hypothetical protein
MLCTACTDISHFVAHQGVGGRADCLLRWWAVHRFKRAALPCADLGAARQFDDPRDQKLSEKEAQMRFRQRALQGAPRGARRGLHKRMLQPPAAAWPQSLRTRPPI